MTSSQLLQQVVPEPFASESDALATISTETPSDEISFKLGFPPAFSAPRSGGGEYILRGMMNAVGNLASANEHFRQAGGLYQFNQKWAAANNGYPKNAVLDFLNGNKLYKVLSLIDNNMYDYTGSTPTETGIIQGGVDGIHWMYCNVDQEVKYNEICEMPDFSWPKLTNPRWNLFKDDVFQIGYFTAPRNGTLGFTGSYDFESVGIPDAGDTYHPGGFLIAVCYDTDYDDIIDSPSAAPTAAKYIYSRGNPIFTVPNGGGNNITEDDVATFNVIAGTNYAIYVVNCGGNVTNSNFKVVLM